MVKQLPIAAEPEAGQESPLAVAAVVALATAEETREPEMVAVVIGPLI